MNDNELLSKFMDQKIAEHNKKNNKKKITNPLLPSITPGQRMGYIYTRVSTTMQKDQGHSLEQQDYQLTEYCKKNNIVIIEKYEDSALSGKTINKRPAIQRMIADLKPNVVVLCATLSRLSRNTHDLLSIHNLIQKAKAELIILDVNIDTTTPAGRMMLTLLGSFAQFEVEQTSERTSKVMSHLSRQGKLKNTPKYGYQRVDGQIVPKEDEQIVIQMITLIIKENPNISINKITTILNNKGFTNRKNNPFHATTVNSIIRNLVSKQNNEIEELESEPEPKTDEKKKEEDIPQPSINGQQAIDNTNYIQPYYNNYYQQYPPNYQYNYYPNYPYAYNQPYTPNYNYMNNYHTDYNNVNYTPNISKDIIDENK
jgi:DNA invertase Pin-like site-specific DNA recombinase